MNTIANQPCTPTGVSTRRWLHRASSAAAIVAIVAAAVGLPVIAPERSPGASPVVAIARADCPPDCGGGPGNGGTPSGPPGGGTEFVPPSMPAMPSYDPGRGQPPLDQNNGISIYNSAAPQPSQAAQPSQAPVQNQDGSFNRAANGEQQPVSYDDAPNNQQINSDWQKLSDQINDQQMQPDQNSQSDQDADKTCESVLAPLFDQGLMLAKNSQTQLSAQSIAALVDAGMDPDQCKTVNASGDGDLKPFDCSSPRNASSRYCTEYRDPKTPPPTRKPPPPTPGEGDRSNGLETVYDLKSQQEIKDYVKFLKDMKQFGFDCPSFTKYLCPSANTMSDQLINKLEQVSDQGKCAEIHVYLGYLGGYTTVTKECG